MDILQQSGAADEAALSEFNQWKGNLKRPLFTPTLNSLCRLCAQKASKKSAALAYATESYTLTKDERSNAESKSEGYLEVARAIFLTSKADAKAYFNEAVEVAGKIGDENLARWDAILDLADRASRADRPTPATAYQFARCAELTYDYVERDKHFDWSSTAIALCGLCPSSTIAILSRWRDRGFGRHERLLPIAIGNLIESQSIDPQDAMPFIEFRAEWNYGKLLGSILTKCQSSEEKATASRILYRYTQFSVFALSKLMQLWEAASKHGVTLDGLGCAIAFAEREEASIKKSSSRYESEPLSAQESPSGTGTTFFLIKT